MNIRLVALITWLIAGIMSVRVMEEDSDKILYFLCWIVLIMYLLRNVLGF
jgi:hypothetical protein